MARYPFFPLEMKPVLPLFEHKGALCARALSRSTGFSCPRHIFRTAFIYLYFLKMTPATEAGKCQHSVWTGKGDTLLSVAAVIERGECFSQGGLAVCKYDGKQKRVATRRRRDWEEKRGEVVSAVRLFALLRRNSSENFCHIVLTQQGATDRRRGEKREEKQS